MANTTTIYTVPTSTVDDLSKHQIGEKMFHNKVTHYESVSPETKNPPHTWTTVQQPQLKSTRSMHSTSRSAVPRIDNIDTYTVWSILNTFFCCMLLGCVAYGFSKATAHLKRTGNIQGALKASRTARILNILATLTGITIIVCAVV
jgi:hypothetical protein